MMMKPNLLGVAKDRASKECSVNKFFSKTSKTFWVKTSDILSNALGGSSSVRISNKKSDILL